MPTRPIRRPTPSTTRALAILGLGALALTGCQAVEGILGEQRPTVQVKGARIQDLALDALTLAFDLEVHNPYSVPLPVAKLDYRLASARQPFLSGEGAYQGAIPARGSAEVPLTARLAFADALAVLQGVRPGAVVPYDAEIGVSVDAPGLGPLRLPVRRSGELPVPALPEVALNGIQWRSLSLQEASAVLELEIGNTNAFAIELSRLDYSLSLAGEPIVSSDLQEAMTLRPGARSTLRIPISFSPASLGLAGFNVLRGAGADYALTGSLLGTTRFGPLRLPLQKTGRTSFSR